MSTLNTLSGGKLTKQVQSPVDDGLDAVRGYLAGDTLDAATEAQVKKLLARVVPPKNVIETTIEYSFYPKQPDLTEPVDVITITEKNTVTLATTVRKIKHYLDGTQPHEI